MDPISLISLFFFFLPFCCFGVLFVGMFGLLLWFMVRRFQPLTPEERSKAEAEARRILDGAVPNLLPWSREAFPDLAAEWDGSYRQILTFFASGRCPSLRDPQSSWLTFVLNFKANTTGFLLARTSNREARLDFGDDSVTATVDGQLLGVMRLSSGEIYNTARQSIGVCRRDQGTQIFIEGIELGPSHRFYPLTLNGREIAKISTTTGRVSIALGPRAPLVANLTQDLKPEEEDWLLALCALEVGYYGPRRSLWRSRRV
jgi:hypothetical protein